MSQEVSMVVATKGARAIINAAYGLKESPIGFMVPSALVDPVQLLKALGFGVTACDPETPREWKVFFATEVAKSGERSGNILFHGKWEDVSDYSGIKGWGINTRPNLLDLGNDFHLHRLYHELITAEKPALIINGWDSDFYSVEITERQLRLI